MGYTTTFEGRVTFDAPLLPRTILRLQGILGEDSRDNAELRRQGAPSGYCQWELTTKNGVEGLEWDGGEKFYDSDDWMKFLVEKVLTDYTCNGTIMAQGEEIGDIWLLVVKNSVVQVLKGKEMHQYLAKAGGNASIPVPTVGDVIRQLERDYRESDEAPGFFNDDGDLEIILKWPESDRV